MLVNIKSSINQTCWRKINQSSNPFLNHLFFRTLEETKVVNKETGWTPIYFEEPQISILYTFTKTHSYGEYIFDWNWANAFHENAIPYYPKLTSMIPFTPATTSHFIGDVSVNVMNAYEKYYNENGLTSSHFLFIDRNEIDFFKSYGYIIRDSFQYHFEAKDHSSFENFLSTLKSKKAKQIRKERTFSKDIQFQTVTGADLTRKHAIEMFNFYQSTLKLKNAISYLNLNFFISIFEQMKENICYMRAIKNGNPIAGSLFFYGTDTLYGRYWGCTEEVQNLHFELCYYRGIDFCIDNDIDKFEAGAQGEHKIARGFKPVKTYSAHKLKHSDFHKAISKYIEDERIQINEQISYLSERQPFKKS
jgi:predicted N-acyltransferase